VTTLAQALQQEHVDIDAGIDGEGTMLDAIAALRRHIYLEEKLLFPPLREAGMLGPVMVMLLEHGQMWHLMDELEPILREDPADPRIGSLRRDLVAQIEAHNPKEEMILYPQADTALDEESSSELRDFLEAGSMPDGWVCDRA